MAKHFAQQVVDALQTKLGGLTTTKANVFSEDDYPRESSKLPCLNIQADGFDRATRGMGGARPQATNAVTIVIQCVAKAKGSGRALALQIAKEVEEAWLGAANDERLVGLVTPPVHRATLQGVVVQVDQGEQAYAVAEMRFQVTVLSLEGRPDLT